MQNVKQAVRHLLQRTGSFSYHSGRPSVCRKINSLLIKEQLKYDCQNLSSWMLLLAAGSESVETEEWKKNRGKRPAGKIVAAQQFRGVTPVPKSVQKKIRILPFEICGSCCPHRKILSLPSSFTS